MFSATADIGLPWKNWFFRLPESEKPTAGCRNTMATSNRCLSAARARGTYPRAAKGSIDIGGELAPAVAASPEGDGFVPAAMRRIRPQAASICGSLTTPD